MTFDPAEIERVLRLSEAMERLCNLAIEAHEQANQYESGVERAVLLFISHFAATEVAGHSAVIERYATGAVLN